MLRLVNWINTAWVDIQNERDDWQWMRAATSFTTVASQATYTTAQCGIAAGSFSAWARDTFRSFTTAVGTRSEVSMDYLDYEDWRDGYFIGALRDTQAQPMVVSITPAKTLALGPVPAAGYTVTGDYYTNPVEMAANADTPSMPGRYHMAIIYRAMMHYGMYESAPEVHQRGEIEFNKLMRRVLRDQLPEIVIGSALA